jgi:hypothetical protein
MLFKTMQHLTFDNHKLPTIPGEGEEQGYQLI